MPSKLPFYAQETLESCAPACLRMVLASFGLELPEAELRARCDCTAAFGTDALMVVEAARQLGFPLTAKHNLNLAELEELVNAGHFPIIFVNLDPLDGLDEQHALVVIALNKSTTTVYDPLFGERILERESFSAAWGLKRNLAILVAR
jgi:ABC-type bacteriocin/lantibiotic exporter with double-glycine peptidase domain